jgi:hypothetical protein
VDPYNVERVFLEYDAHDCGLFLYYNRDEIWMFAKIFLRSPPYFHWRDEGGVQEKILDMRNISTGYLGSIYSRPSNMIFKLLVNKVQV